MTISITIACIIAFGDPVPLIEHHCEWQTLTDAVFGGKPNIKSYV